VNHGGTSQPLSGVRDVARHPVYTTGKNYYWRNLAMNQTFKLGKVSIPVNEEGLNIEIEGLEIKVEGLDLREYIQFMKEMPSVIVGLRHAMEIDIDDLMEQAQEEEEGIAGGEGFESVIDSILAGKGLGGFTVEKMNHSAPNLEDLFKGAGEEKDPELSLFEKLAKAKAGQSMGNPLEQLLKGGMAMEPVNHPLFGKGMSVKIHKDHPLADILKGLADKGE
jgi:hypothetical protein